MGALWCHFTVSCLINGEAKTVASIVTSSAAQGGGGSFKDRTLWER